MMRHAITGFLSGITTIVILDIAELMINKMGGSTGGITTLAEDAIPDPWMIVAGIIVGIVFFVLPMIKRDE